MDERDNRTFRNAEGINAFLHSADRFVEGFTQHINRTINDLYAAYPHEMRILGEYLTILGKCITVDGRIAQHKERYNEHGVRIGFDEACMVVAGLTLWSPLPYTHSAKNRPRPENALPYIYDYEIEAVKAKRDKAYRMALIERSATEKLAWDTLQCLLNHLRDDGEEDIPRDWNELHTWHTMSQEAGVIVPEQAVSKQQKSVMTEYPILSQRWRHVACTRPPTQHRSQSLLAMPSQKCCAWNMVP